LDPRGLPAEWIAAYEVKFSRDGGAPLTEMYMFADGSGTATWLRIGTLDSEGIWGVNLTIDGEQTVENYSVSQFQLSNQGTELVGIEMRKYQGSVSDTYYSALVPATLAVDLQAHLGWVAARFQELQGLQSATIPDIYLAGNQSLFEQVAAATGTIVGFETGFYRKSGSRPGIYMRTDFFRTNILRLLTHEYVHLVLDGVSVGREIPAWLNEGTARYFEYTLNLEGERPDATRLRVYRDADKVRTAALDETIIDLRDLESLEIWNGQTDDAKIGLQYAEGYMAVRYLTETYGEKAAVSMIKSIGRGANIFTAVEDETGVAYPNFQTGFREWLKTWEDPRRAGIRGYMAVLTAVMDDETALSARRSQEIALSRPLSQSVADKQDLVADSRILVNRLGSASPPPELNELHQISLSYLRRVNDWLTLELEFVQTGANPKRVQANEMIPEINARGNQVIDGIGDVEFVYNLRGPGE